MSDWQPIETAPKDGTKIVAWAHGKYAFAFYRAKKYGKASAYGWSLTFMNGYKLHTEDEPTHWMPLPKGPTPIEQT